MLKSMIVGLALAGLVAPTAALAASRAERLVYQEQCDNVLEGLRIVPPATVAAIGSDATVVIHPICRGVSMNTFGNAGGLSHAIAANPHLAAALSRGNWSADDVVGIRFGGGDSVHLYVHRG
jgi:hypothetical protein